MIHHTSGGTGSEPGQATLGTFTFLSTTTAPFDQLTLADVQQYSQPVSYGITSYEMKQWMSVAFVQDRYRVSDQLTLDLGLRYDRQTLTTATNDFAPRLGFAWHPNADSRTVVRGGYAMYYTQIRANAIASALTGGLDGITTYTATPGQTGFPTCLTCVPVQIDPRTLPLNQQPARNITIQAAMADFYKQQFASYGLNFDPLLANYPDHVRESAQPGDDDRRRARDHARPVRRRRLRASALGQPRSHRRSERTDAVRSHRARPGPDSWPRRMRPARFCRSTAAFAPSTC